MKQKITLLLLLTSTLLYGQVTKTDRWETALEKAKVENKDILIILTGSEWCKPCVKLERDVMSQSTFIDFANERLVIFEINLPQHQDMNSKVVKDYHSFRTKYQTNALPTLVLVDQNGVEKTKIAGGRISVNDVIKKLKEAM